VKIEWSVTLDDDEPQVGVFSIDDAITPEASKAALAASIVGKEVERTLLRLLYRKFGWRELADGRS
jgi:hypothetical protein